MSSRLFNPFAVFNRKVARKFLIRSRDYGKYTEEQLNEEIPHNLRIFNIDGKVWYLAKDVTSYLGIDPKHLARALEKLNSNDVRQEDVTLKKDGPTCGAMPKSPTRSYKLSLITEAGIYALIQKSRTTYAEMFKQWLNEQVLPSIRQTGEYKAESSLKEDIMKAKAEQDEREWVAECTSKDEEKEEKDDIADELDKELGNLETEIQATRETVTRALNQESTMMNLLRTIQGEMVRDREERKKRDEEKEEEHRREREQDARDKEQMKKDLSELKDKMNIIVKDRIVPGVVDQKRELFIIMDTHEEDLEPERKAEWRFPYYIIKCQQGTKDAREAACRAKYPQAEEIFVLPQPNTKSLSDVVKSKCEEREIPVQFYRNCFYFVDDETTIQVITNLVTELENERTRV